MTWADGVGPSLKEQLEPWPERHVMPLRERFEQIMARPP
jgi:hypothetical protein